jgi:hypothetical protein
MHASVNKIRSFFLLWSACAIEAVLAIVYLLFLPADPASVFFAGYSLVRLLIISCLFGAIIFLGYLSYLSLRQPTRPGFFPSLARLQIAEGWLFYFSLLISILCIFLIILTPPFLLGSRIVRLMPILIWISICGIQIVAFLIGYRLEKIQQTSHYLRDLLIKRSSADRIGYGLLFLSLVVGLITLFYAYAHLGDEGDTYEVGWLISQGQVLYRDVFSHHFPFSYLWIGLVTAIFGPSITFIRLSLLLLRVTLFGISARFSNQAFIIGLTSLAWSLISPLYLGNLLVYYSFDAIFIVSSVFILIAALNKDSIITTCRAVFVSVLVTLAVLSDPLMVIPGGIIIIFLAYIAIRNGATRKERFSLAISPILTGAVILLIFTAYLLLTSSLNDFIKDGILFNTQVYSRYAGSKYTISEFIKSILNNLNIINPSLRTFYSPYFVWQNWQELNQWAFTALFFHVSVIATSVLLLIRSKFSAGVFFFLITLALLIKDVYFFWGIPFTLLAITGAAIIFKDFLLGFFTSMTKLHSVLSHHLVFEYLILAITGLISWMFIVQNVRMGQYWIQNSSNLSYQSQFGSMISTAKHLASLSCGDSQASLLVYPLDPGLYFFSQLPPASRYLFMTPWIADVGEQEVISVLKGKPAVVVISKGSEIWGYPVKSYLKDLITFLDQNYKEVEPDIYVSPLLQEYCKVTSGY